MQVARGELIVTASAGDDATEADLGDPGVGIDSGRIRRVASRVGIVATVLNVIGLGLAIYLTVEHYSTTPSFACPVTGAIDCLKVTTSTYSNFHGIPVAPAGLLYFVVSIPLHLPALWRSLNAWVARARWAWVLIGMASVFWLVNAELELRAICLYCTGVHIVTFFLLVVTAIGTIYAAPTVGLDPDDDLADD